MGQICFKMEAQLAAASPADIPEDIHAEILVRLPAKSVLRFRSVCKAWRRITSSVPHFLAAHARRRPAQLLLYRYVDSSHLDNRPVDYAVDIALDVLPVTGEVAGWRALVSYPKFVATGDSPKRWYSSMPLHCFLLASCDGVLLFQIQAPASYLLCNPLTRQWARLPQLAAGRYAPEEYAFYSHQPSGEYRLLCSHRAFVGIGQSQTTWYVLSTGAAEPRRVDNPHAVNNLWALSLRDTNTTSLALHGRVHWPPRRDMVRRETTEMVAFDTVTERFHVMAGPPAEAGTAVTMKLFAMDGLLVAANFGDAKRRIDLWCLADYGAGRWELLRRLGASRAWSMCGYSPPGMMSMAAAADDRGNIVLGNHYSYCVYNVRNKAWRVVNSVATPYNNVLVSRHVFRESLVQHPGFQAWSSAVDLPLISFEC